MVLVAYSATVCTVYALLATVAPGLADALTLFFIAALLLPAVWSLGRGHHSDGGTA